MKVECLEPPRIFMSPDVKQRLDLYVQSCPLEVSGLGYALIVPGGFRITEVFLFKQEVSAAHTDLDMQSVAQFLTQLIREDRDPELIKLWWHSHGSGSLFWSSTDTGTIDKFNNEWMISIVGNHRGEYKARIDLYEPMRLSVDEISLEVDLVISEALRKEILAEIKLKVKEKRWPGFGLGSYGGKVWRDGRWTQPDDTKGGLPL